MEDSKQMEITSDVVIRFLSHDQYGSEARAIEALTERLGKVDKQKAEANFNRHLDIFKTTKYIVEKKLFNNPHFKPSVFDKIQLEISKKCDCGPEEAGLYINWCYFFYVLK